MKQQRVVITGLGIVSCLGLDVDSVAHALATGKSGITFQEEYQRLGFRSHVAGSISAAALASIHSRIDRKKNRFMADHMRYAYVSALDAIADARLRPEDIQSPRCGVIAGSGGPSTSTLINAVDTLRERGIKRVGPYAVTPTMASGVSAALSTFLQTHGVSYSISSACTTSLHCIGNAYELIAHGVQDVVLAGGSEEEHWSLSVLFDGMRAMAENFNDEPHRASRPFDVDRGGFVIAGGGGMLTMESLEHAEKRGAPIYAEIIGYSATSDGYDMVSPSGLGGAAAMRGAMPAGVKIDYINPHGTGTPVGDVSELHAIKSVFADDIPFISATKSMSGHSLGATGVQEVIYSLLMAKHGWIAPSINIDKLDPVAAAFPIVTEKKTHALNIIMSNSFGFGGTNASIVMQTR